jgi:hypothetical protein
MSLFIIYPTKFIIYDFHINHLHYLWAPRHSIVWHSPEWWKNKISNLNLSKITILCLTMSSALYYKHNTIVIWRSSRATPIVLIFSMSMIDDSKKIIDICGSYNNCLIDDCKWSSKLLRQSLPTLEVSFMTAILL